MLNRIGEAAGKIWTLLATKGPLTINKIKADVGEEAFVVYAAIGWLARENKIDITQSGKTIKVILI